MIKDKRFKQPIISGLSSKVSSEQRLTLKVTIGIKIWELWDEDNRISLLRECFATFVRIEIESATTRS